MNQELINYTDWIMQLIKYVFEFDCESESGLECEFETEVEIEL